MAGLLLEWSGVSTAERSWEVGCRTVPLLGPGAGALGELVAEEEEAVQGLSLSFPSLLLLR